MQLLLRPLVWMETLRKRKNITDKFVTLVGREEEVGSPGMETEGRNQNLNCVEKSEGGASP